MLPLIEMHFLPAVPFVVGPPDTKGDAEKHCKGDDDHEYDAGIEGRSDAGARAIVVCILAQRTGGKPARHA